MDEELPAPEGNQAQKSPGTPPHPLNDRTLNVILYGGMILISILLFPMHQLFLRPKFPFRAFDKDFAYPAAKGPSQCIRLRWLRSDIRAAMDAVRESSEALGKS
jgi:hypothetical protein